MRKSLFPQEDSIPKYLKKSPFATPEQINLMMSWIVENPMDKSGEIKFVKLANINKMRILVDAPLLTITQQDINEMMQSLNMISKAGEKISETCSAMDLRHG